MTKLNTAWYLGEVYEQAAGIILEMPDCFCCYLDVYGVRLSRTEHFAASVATLVYRPVASHFDLWQGQPKEGGQMMMGC